MDSQPRTPTHADQKRSFLQHREITATPAASWGPKPCRAASLAPFSRGQQPRRMRDSPPPLARRDRLTVQPWSAVMGLPVTSGWCLDQENGFDKSDGDVLPLAACITPCPNHDMMLTSPGPFPRICAANAETWCSGACKRCKHAWRKRRET